MIEGGLSKMSYKPPFIYLFIFLPGLYTKEGPQTDSGAGKLKYDTMCAQKCGVVGKGLRVKKGRLIYQGKPKISLFPLSSLLRIFLNLF